MLVYKRFKRVMTVVNALFAIPVIWVLIRELTGAGPIRLSRVLAVTALVAIPLAGTIAITITGSAVLSDD